MKTGTKILLAGAGLATLYLLSREATGSSHQYFIRIRNIWQIISPK